MTKLTVYANPAIEPSRRNDHSIDERSLYPMENGRFVSFVDDSDRGEQHAGTHIERTSDQEVHVRLLKLKLSVGLVRHHGVFKFQFGHKADAVGEAV